MRNPKEAAERLEQVMVEHGITTPFSEFSVKLARPEQVVSMVKTLDPDPETMARLAMMALGKMHSAGTFYNLNEGIRNFLRECSMKESEDASKGKGKGKGRGKDGE